MTKNRDIRFRPQGKGVNQVLGELQTRVMERLWTEGAMSLSALHLALSRQSDVAYTTVATELTRLQRKRLVRKTGVYLETRYSAAIEREKFIERFVGDVLAGLVDAHGRAAIHGFVDAIGDDDAALEETLRLITERQNAR